MPATGYQQEGRLKRTTGALCVAGLLTMILFSTTVAQSMRPQGALFIATNDEYTHLLTVRPDLELADLRTLLSPAIFDIRYATADNFTGRRVYPNASARLRRPAAMALQRAAAGLERQGYRLIILDAYRPYSATITFWNIVRDARYAADPRYGSRHNRGTAVDASLARHDGTPCEMPSAFDDFGPRAHRNNPGMNPAAARNLKILEEALAAQGFVPYAAEWWHFDYPDQGQAVIFDIIFPE